MKQHQISHTTEYNRYPHLFQITKEHFNSDAIKILSFGCADGTEVKTLRELYYPNAIIYGADINSQLIDHCNQNNKDPFIKYFLTSEILNKIEKFDLIFCMSVLCRWPQTEHINNSAGIYEFSEFEDQIQELNNHLNPGGLLVIYNCNYCFIESSLYSTFTPFTDSRISESGFVHKFNSKHQKIEINYKDCIFIKKHY